MIEHRELEVFVKYVSLFVFLFLLYIAKSTCHASLKIMVDSKDPSLIVLDNDEYVEDVVGFLVWLDLDEYLASDGARGIVSWTSSGWIEGLHQALERPFDALVVQRLAIARVPRSCPEGHRCFVGAALQGPETEPPVLSFYPLSHEAALERLPGQWKFASYGSGYAPTDSPYANDQLIGAPTVSSQEGAGQSRVQVEKPDLYKVVQGDGRRPSLLLISVSSAERLVILDVDEPSSPRVVDSLIQEGEPKEIYNLGNAFFTVSSTGNETFIASHLWSIDERGLVDQENMRLAGTLMESRRRGDVLYVVTSVRRDYVTPLREQVGAPISVTSPQAVLYAVAAGQDGNMTLLTSRVIDGYPEVVSICADFLTLVTRDSATGGTLLDVTALGDEDDPMEGPFHLPISGTIPSDRHINCFVDREGGDSYLIFVEGPTWSSQERGSTLHIYKRERATDGRFSLAPVSKIEGIAPGESLFGTVISEQKAYIVTYERKDPLWVIDFSDPSHPRVEGELILPGWSEKLFFHDHRLFSVGFLDSSDEVQTGSMRLVSLGLFDVSDPTSPRLTSRVTPFLGMYDYSWSEATSDERALFLDWDMGRVALPLEIYSADSPHWLGAYEIRGDSLRAYDPRSIPFRAKRALWLDDQHLVAFSDRMLTAFTARFPGLDAGQELALVPAIDWLERLGGGGSILGFSMDREIYRGLVLDEDCIFSGEEVEGCLEKAFTIPHGFNWAEVAKDRRDSFLLFDRSGPRIAFLKFPSQDTPGIEGPYRINVGEDTRNSLRGLPAYANGIVLLPFNRYDYMWQSYSTGVYALFEDEFQGSEVVSGRVLSIPGTMAGLTSSGNLVTVEDVWDEGARAYSTRVNLLEVQRDQAILRESEILERCRLGGAYIDGETVFIVCGGPIHPVPLMDAGAEEANVLSTNGSSSMVPSPDGDRSRLVVLDASDRLKKVGEFLLHGSREELVRADANSGLLFTISYGGGIYWEGVRSYMPWYGSRCRLYRFDNGGGTLRKLMEFSGQCQGNPHGVLLTDDAVALARGLKGVEIVGK